MDTESDTIFVSIAAYRDPLVDFTLLSALSQARAPERLRFGIVDQADERRARDLTPAMRRQIRAVHLDSREARGPCWARALAMSLARDETWFLQVDAHTMFEPHWDETLCRWGRWALQREPRSILTTYPNPFRFVDGQPQAAPVTQRVLALVVADGQALMPDDPVLRFEGVPVERDTPLAAFHVAAGCLFAPGRLVHELPYDPFLYFHGEEQAYALRAWTRGWDLWHIPGMPLLHLYARDAVAKALHWDADDARRAAEAAELDRLSRARLARLLGPDGQGGSMGVYGLGTARSLQAYATFSGIDYRRGMLHPRSGRKRHAEATAD